jgi:hypothetical protein
MARDPDLFSEIAARDVREDLAQRAAWAGSPDLLASARSGQVRTSGVSGPGLAALNAGDDRAPRTAGESAAGAPSDRDNWILTGPRNIGGRISALAVAGSDPQRWYAGTAAGGPYRSDDGGQTWFPLWHDETSLSVGAIAVSPQDADTLYVATGENESNGLAIAGHGILVSTNGGEDWLSQAPGIGPHPAHDQGFDAIAVDPTASDHCIAVGKDGIFHTRNGGADWDHIAEGTYFSDVAFLDTMVYLVRATSVAGEGAILRIDNTIGITTVAAFEAQLAVAANGKTLAGPIASHVAWPGRGKISIFPGTPGRIYARFVDTDGRHLGVWRCSNPRAANAAATTWDRQGEHHGWVEERQGMYNLTIAVNPADRGQVATGMVHVHASGDGGGAWTTAMHWALHDDGVRSQHADQHQFVVSPDGHLWAGNDGGVFESENWASGEAVLSYRPVPVGSVRWKRRDMGIAAAQMYDLNQSPLLPGLQALGMQDNASHMTTGGATWRQVDGGDGSFILFDPDDPYRYLVTTQNTISAAQFPGYSDKHFPREQAPGVPAVDRALDHGFLDFDAPAFVAESDRHVTDPGRTLLARRGRLYGSRAETGERWRVEQAGSAVELVYTSASVDDAVVRVLPTLGAVRLGFVPGTTRRSGRYEPLTDTQRSPVLVRLFSRLRGPFALVDGDELAVELDGVEHRARFNASDVDNISATTISEVVQILTAAFPAALSALPTFWYQATAVELVTRGIGTGQTITLAGPAAAPLAVDGLSPLGINAGTYSGSGEMPASVTLGFVGFDHASSRLNRDLSSVDRLDVSINGGPVRAVDLTSLPDRANVSPGEVAALLRAALAGDEVDVVDITVTKGIRVIARDGNTVMASGTAAERLGLAPNERTSILMFGRSRTEVNQKHHVRNRNSFDLEPPGPAPLELSITDGVNTAGPVQITAGPYGNLRCVTVEELYRTISELVDGSGVDVDVQLEIFVLRTPPTEVVVSDARPGEAWVGAADGSVLRTVDGVSWSDAGVEEFRLGASPVEAIALHPNEPDTVFVGILSERSTGHLPTLYTTSTAGDIWTQIDDIKVDGSFVGVHAIEIDPKAPNEVFVATTGGLFRSSDGGTTWRRLNQGLANVPITDLAFDAGTGRLRAGVWGRGSYVRTVRDATPRDVEVFVRSSESDDGSGRRAPAVPNVFASDPSPARHSSPDIKYVSALAPELAARRVDGVEFDLDLVDDPVVPGESGVMLVQIHNAAALPASGLRVVVLAAQADVNPPPLPHDVWMSLRAGPLTDPVGSWTLLADVSILDPMPANAPLVEPVPVLWPGDLSGPTVGVLVLVEASGDTIEEVERSVEGLINTERRAAYRQFPVVSEASSRTLVLKATPGHTFEVTEPEAGSGTDASTALDINGAMVAGTTGLVGMVAAVAPSGATLALPAEAAVAVYAEPLDVTIDFDNTNADFSDITQATPFEVEAYVSARLGAAGAQASIFTSSVGLRLVASGGATVSPTGGRVASALGWSAGHADRHEAISAGGFDITGSGNPHLRLEIQAQGVHAIDIEFDPRHFSSPARARGRRLALLINRALSREQVDGLVRAEPINGLVIVADFDGTVLCAGPAAGTLGLPVAPFSGTTIAPGLVDLSGTSMTMTVRNGVNVRFDRYPDLLPDLGAATPSQVRRVINEHLSLANMPVRAIVGQSRIVAEDLATSNVVEAVPAEPIFTYHGGYLTADLEAGEENHLYVRLANPGTVDAVDVVVKLHLIDMGAAPIGRTEVDAETVTVDALSAAIAHVQFDAPADTRGVWLMATGGLDLPSTDWNTPQEVRGWAAGSRGAVLKRFDVAGAVP